MSVVVRRVEEKPAVVVSRTDYEVDFRRGYCITEFHPEREEILEDRRTGKKVKRLLPAVLNFCCMKCRFSTTNEDLIKQHIFHAEHPWGFGPFDNPYGHIADVVIEGIEDYSTVGEKQE